MTNCQSKPTFGKSQMKYMPSGSYSALCYGMGVSPLEEIVVNESCNDAHVWCEDSNGNIYDSSPVAGIWAQFEPTKHYKKADNSEQLVCKVRAFVKRRELFFKQAFGEVHDFYKHPVEDECFANAIALQQQAPELLHLVVGSQGFRGKGGNTIFWEFG